MSIAAAHVLMFFVAAAIARFGWFMAHKPERAIRIFLFGQDPAFGRRFAIAWSKSVGWMFTIVGCFGSVLYPVLIAFNLFHAR